MKRRRLGTQIGAALMLSLACLFAQGPVLAEPPATTTVDPPADAQPAAKEAAPKQTAPAPAESSDEDATIEPSAATDVDGRLNDKETLELIKVFVDSLDQIDRNYVKPVNRRELVEAAIEGMLDRLDPYSSYIAPSDVDRFRSNVENQFGGIGIQVSMEEGQLKIISPLVGTPAYRAGLMAGDSILEIDGKSVKDLALDAAIRRLKGAVGTNVSMTVHHAGSTERKTVTMTREIVHVESVLGDHRQTNDSWDYLIDHQKRIGYIRITSFGRETAGDLQRALTELQKEKMRGLILDLRFNPGGLLSSAIETCDLFVDQGRIVSTKGRNTPERVWDAKKEGTFTGFPMAVLVNHYSASASEIVSACLQDHKRAVIVGQRSWGKGSVQNVIDLEGGHSVLKLTTASYWRPSGKNIHRFPDAKESDEWGVKPDSNFEIVLNNDETRQLVEDRRQRDIVLPHLSASAAALKDAHPKKDTAPATAATAKETKKPADEAKAVSPFIDRQLQKAVEYLDVEVARAG